MIRKLISWMVKRTDWLDHHPLTSWDTVEGKSRRVAHRYAPFFTDEIQRGDDTIYKPLPWYMPFNILLHNWREHDDMENMHDHPRWTFTICLKGELIEKTPWGERVLRPGSMVLRSPRYIHGFRVTAEHSCRTWTLFLVGRRRYPQNSYIVKRNTEAAKR